MVMSQAMVKGLVSDLFPEWRDATAKAKMLDLWFRGENDDPAMPLHAASNKEYKALGTISPSPWGRLIVKASAQTMAVSDHRNDTDNAGSTLAYQEAWKPNGFPSRQGSVYRGALAHNLAFVKTLPGKRPHTGKPTVYMRGVSATKMVAWYDNEGEDDFARFALEGDIVIEGGEISIAWQLHDDEATYFASSEHDGTDIDFIEYRIHNVGVTPVHRFSPDLDLDGRATGEIQPFLPLLRRIDQDNFDRLVVQRFNSWRTRTISGMVKPETDDEKRAAAMALRVEDLLVSSSTETKFGTLDPTDMAPYIAAREADIKDLAATSQTPPHHLLGQMANLSAEALAAAETSLMRKTEEYKLSFAQSWDQVFRSVGFIMARIATSDREKYEAEATNYSSSVRWKDSASRSLSQLADALGKLSDQLGIPPEMLWEELPFWNEEDTGRAKELIADQELKDELNTFLDTAANSATPAERRARGDA